MKRTEKKSRRRTTELRCRCVQASEPQAEPGDQHARTPHPTGHRPRLRNCTASRHPANGTPIAPIGGKLESHTEVNISVAELSRAGDTRSKALDLDGDTLEDTANGTRALTLAAKKDVANIEIEVDDLIEGIATLEVTVLGLTEGIEARAVRVNPGDSNARFASLDSNGDGLLSLDEYQAPNSAGDVQKVFVIRQEVRDELARSTFEKPRLESVLARLREQIVAILADSHKVLADVAAELSESERAALAGRMTSRLIVREADRFARLKIEDRSAGPDGDRDEEVYSEAAVPEDASVQDDAPNLE